MEPSVERKEGCGLAKAFHASLLARSKPCQARPGPRANKSSWGVHLQPQLHPALLWQAEDNPVPAGEAAAEDRLRSNPQHSRG